jgi:hypothetical protein
MLVPKKTISPDLDQAFDQLVEHNSPFVNSQTGISKEEFERLEDAEKMAFFNLESKLKGTRIAGNPLILRTTGLRHVEPDRVYVMMSSEAKQLIEDSPDFVSAPGHGRPAEKPELPDHPDSWKHDIYPTGNIQLSFADSSEAWPSDSVTQSYSVDVDIDLEKGLRHVWEWLENNVFRAGQKTDQTIVYALLFSQGIIPEYTLSVRA